jgi:hypothetical protein
VSKTAERLGWRHRSTGFTWWPGGHYDFERGSSVDIENQINIIWRENRHEKVEVAIMISSLVVSCNEKQKKRGRRKEIWRWLLFYIVQNQMCCADQMTQQKGRDDDSRKKK